MGQRPTTDVDDDTTSDPALDDEASDWSSEGGATPAGPATDTDAADNGKKD